MLAINSNKVEGSVWQTNTFIGGLNMDLILDFNLDGCFVTSIL